LYFAVEKEKNCAMKDQVHIRNIEAAQLARTLARQTGKTINDVVLEALRQYHPRRPIDGDPERVADWRRILQEDREAGLAKPETPIEAFYNPTNGLPA
jgi:hypothetical protein